MNGKVSNGFPIFTYEANLKSLKDTHQTAPMHGQTQAFWSADKRKRSEAVENRAA